MEELGGARVHSEITGNAHFFATSEAECFEQIKRLVTFIPWNNGRKALRFEPKEPKKEYNISEIVPDNPATPYDVRDVIRSLVDDSDFFEIMNGHSWRLKYEI